jgi:hypothetical protein
MSRPVTRCNLIGYALAIAFGGAYVLVPDKARAGCSGDPHSPIRVNVTAEDGMTVGIGNLYKMVRDGQAHTYSRVRCFDPSDTAVSTALDKAVKDICDPTKTVPVNFADRTPTQDQFNKFCIANGFRAPGLVTGPRQ